jgi:hypothetical protein
MHSFDIGMSKGAKKNNWTLLEKIFIKQAIPISKDLCQKVAMAKPKFANMVTSFNFNESLYL